MKLPKIKTEFLLFGILLGMLAGILTSKYFIEKIEGTITTDYPVVYRDHLDRLLGEGWRVLGEERGYTVTPFDRTNIYSWEIGYEDKEGVSRSILISNFEDRSMDCPLGYCIEKNFQEMAAEEYAREVVGPVIPAVSWEPGYWIGFLNYYVSGDNVTHRPYGSGRERSNPMAEAALRTHPLYSESDSSKGWEDPDSGLNLYDIDYQGIFREKPEYWYLSVFADLSLEGLTREEYREGIEELKGKMELVLDNLNRYTGHTVNAELIFPSGIQESNSRYCHWYVIQGEIVDKTVSNTGLPVFTGIDPMYYQMQKYYEK